MEDLHKEIEQLRQNRAKRQPQPPRRAKTTEKREGFFGIFTSQAILSILLVLCFMAGSALFPPETEAFKKELLQSVAEDFSFGADVIATVGKWFSALPEEVVSDEVQETASGQEDTPLSMVAVDSSSLLFPLEGDFRISSRYGYRSNPLDGKWELHSGVDLAAAEGTPIRAAADGIIVASGYTDDLGNRIRIDHGNGLYTLYGHCKDLQVDEGVRIRQGEIIGSVGNSGNSTGVHLHFSVRQGDEFLDPAVLFPFLWDV